MPISTPNRAADPVSLEAYEAPCIVRQEGGLFIPFYNKTTNDTLIAGEPIVHAGRVCIVQKTILPGKMGTLLADWIVDAILDPALAADIDQNQIVYWNTTLNVVKPIEGGSAVAGIGAASDTTPGASEGFILGRASGPHFEHGPPNLDGSGNMICAETGAKRVRVVAIPGAPTEY